MRRCHPFPGLAAACAAPALAVLTLAALALAAPLPALAQEGMRVTGGELRFARSAFTGASSFARTTLGGSVELGFNRDFAAQADLNALIYNAVDETVTNLAVHGIYHLSEATSTGVFLGQDRVSGSAVEFLGLEAGHGADRLEAEGYVLVGREDGETYSLLGLSGRYGVTPALWLGASLDTGDVTIVDGTRYSLDGEYRTQGNLTLYASLGQLDGSVLGSDGRETYVSVGGKIRFGAARGATFGQRSLFNPLPGF